MQAIREVEITNTFFQKQKIYFHDRLAILIGGHCSGKTTVLETLEDGFDGKNPHFLVNNEKVTKSDFQVMYLKDHFSLKEEIKLNKTSPFRQHIVKAINRHLLAQDKYQRVVDGIKQLSQEIEKVISELFSDNLHALTNKNITLKFDTDDINLEHIIELLEVHLFDQKKQTVLKDNSYNQFLLRMVVFNVLRVVVDEKDNQRPIIVLFDNPELYTTLKTSSQLNVILQKLMENTNFYLVFASNSVEYLTSLPHSIKSLNWLRESQIVHFDRTDDLLQKGVAIYHFLLNDQYQNFDDYFENFNAIFDTKKDLPKEWELFYRFQYNYLLKAFFFDEVVFQEVDAQKGSYLSTTVQKDTYQLQATYALPIISICLLISFFDHLNFRYLLSQPLLDKRKKLSTILFK